jgi:hypothetical protein
MTKGQIMTNRERAITIAMGTFLSEYDGTEVETYEKLCAEPEGTEWYQIDYATVWCPFENDPIDYVMGNATQLVEQIERALDAVSK